MTAIPQPFSDKPAAEWIALLLQPVAAEERVRALQAIGRLTPPTEVARWAAHCLSDTDPTVKALASKLIGTISVPLSHENETRLISLLADQDPDVRFESARTLIRQKSTQTTQIVTVLLDFLDEPETHPLMTAAVLDVIVASDLDEASAERDLLPRLKRLLDHERAEVREAVSSAFAKWPHLSTTCVDQILPLLDDREPIIRENIAFALGHASAGQNSVTNEALRAALQTACQDEDFGVALVATESLKKLTNKSHS